jgi:hypothetical protein
LAVVLALGAAALAVPATAAATITVSLQSGTLTITANAQDNDVTIGSAGSNVLGSIVSVAGRDEPMQGGAGCQGFGDPNGPANDKVVFCPANDVQRVQVNLLEGDDKFEDDLNLDGTINGGSGDDLIHTGSGASTVNGGIGDDEIIAGGSFGSDRPNALDGGGDDDTFDISRATGADDVVGGSGVDGVLYATHGAVNVTLDDSNNDGSTNEHDNIHADVEDVTGTAGGDKLVGSSAANRLDGVGGTDRLEGLDGPDTLIGGSGSLDATFGGAGSDLIKLRDGLTDKCPDGGPDPDTFDLDLVDQVTVLASGLTLPRCLFRSVFPTSTLRSDLIVIGAVDEGPNVRMTVPPPVVRRVGVRARMACPAVLDMPCTGRLRVFTFGGQTALGSVAYSVRPGHVRLVTVPLGPAARRAARATVALRLVSVEKGRSKLGPKRTIRFVPVA